MPKTRAPYDEEFRREAVGLLARGERSLAALSKELGVSQQTLRTWRKRAGIEAGKVEGLTRDEREELRRVKRDAIRLARLLAAGELTLVTIPSVEREQLRDLVRCREDIRADLMLARHRIGKFLLGREIYWEGTGEAWSRKHRLWLTSVRFGASEAGRASPLAHNNSAIGRLSNAHPGAALANRQRTCDEQRSWGTQPPNMSMTTVANPRAPGPPTAPPYGRPHDGAIEMHASGDKQEIVCSGGTPALPPRGHEVNRVAAWSRPN